FVAHRLGNPVGAEDHRVAVGHFVELLDEDRTALLEVVDHVAVVHDLVAHVDRRAQRLDRTLDDLDRAVDAGAEAAGVGEQDIHAAILPLPRLERCCPCGRGLPLKRELERPSAFCGSGYSRSHRQPSYRVSGFFAAKIPNRAMPMAPPTMAASAMLNAGQ